MEWVKCSKRLPEKYEEVMLCEHGEIVFGVLVNDGLQYFHRKLGEYICSDSIYWMPLPKPPED